MGLPGPQWWAGSRTEVAWGTPGGAVGRGERWRAPQQIHPPLGNSLLWPNGLSWVPKGCRPYKPCVFFCIGGAASDARVVWDPFTAVKKEHNRNSTPKTSKRNGKGLKDLSWEEMEWGNKNSKDGERQERGRNPPFKFTLGQSQGAFLRCQRTTGGAGPELCLPGCSLTWKCKTWGLASCFLSHWNSLLPSARHHCDTVSLEN